MIPGVEFAETITLGGAIVAALLAMAGLMTYAYGVRWKTAYQVAEANATAWEDTTHRMEERVRALESEHGHCAQQLRELRARIAELEALPDIAAVAAMLREHDDRTSVAMREHDANAEVRAGKIVDAIHDLKAEPPWQP